MEHLGSTSRSISGKRNGEFDSDRGSHVYVVEALHALDCIEELAEIPDCQLNYSHSPENWPSYSGCLHGHGYNLVKHR